MKKNRVQAINIYTDNAKDSASVRSRIDTFYITLIERRLHHSNLTIQQKLTVLDQLLFRMKPQNR